MSRQFPTVEERQVGESVENLAKRSISTIITGKAVLKEKRAELEDMLLENDMYRRTVKVAKEMAKDKAEARKTALKNNQKAMALEAQVKDIKSELSAKQISLFDYLLELNRKTGATEITDLSGQKHNIEIQASIPSIKV